MNIHSIRLSGRALGIVFLTAVLPWCYPTTGMAVDFASPVSYHVGTLISAAGPADFIAVADFNGDGQPDIAVPNPGSGNVSVLLNNGDDTFKPARNFDVGMASPTSIEVADFNNDGIQDLAVWSVPDPAHATLSVLLGNRDGTFPAPKVTTLPAAVDQATLDLVVADFNLDHRSDLVALVHDVNGGGSSRVYLMAGKGDGTFQAPEQISDSLSTVVDTFSDRKYLVAAD